MIAIEPSLPFPVEYTFNGSVAVLGLLDGIELECIWVLSCRPALSACHPFLFFSTLSSITMAKRL